jgi:hypothetical protein
VTGTVGLNIARLKQWRAEMTYTETRAQNLGTLTTRLGTAAKGAAGVGGMLALTKSAGETNKSLAALERIGGAAASASRSVAPGVPRRAAWSARCSRSAAPSRRRRLCRRGCPARRARSRGRRPRLPCRSSPTPCTAPCRPTTTSRLPRCRRASATPRARSSPGCSSSSTPASRWTPSPGPPSASATRRSSSPSRRVRSAPTSLPQGQARPGDPGARGLQGAAPKP